MFVIKRTISKFVVHMLVKKYTHVIEKDESDKSCRPEQLWFFFLIETVNIQDSAHINQIKNENSDWSINLPSNGIPVSYLIYTGAQCNVIPLTFLKKFDAEPDLYPMNMKVISI